MFMLNEIARVAKAFCGHALQHEQRRAVGDDAREALAGMRATFERLGDLLDEAMLNVEIVDVLTQADVLDQAELVAWLWEEVAC